MLKLLKFSMLFLGSATDGKRLDKEIAFATTMRIQKKSRFKCLESEYLTQGRHDNHLEFTPLVVQTVPIDALDDFSNELSG